MRAGETQNVLPRETTTLILIIYLLSGLTGILYSLAFNCVVEHEINHRNNYTSTETAKILKSYRDILHFRKLECPWSCLEIYDLAVIA